MWYIYAIEPDGGRMWLIGTVMIGGVTHPQFTVLGRAMGLRTFDAALGIVKALEGQGYDLHITQVGPGKDERPWRD